MREQLRVDSAGYAAWAKEGRMNEAGPLERKNTHMTMKILLADDDRLIQQLYGQHIENAGFELVRAWDGLEALELAAAKRPQVAVLDMQMPGLDGLSAVLELRKQEAMKRIPVVLISWDPNSLLHKERVQEMGAAVLLTKPFNAEQLLGAIFGLLIEAARNGELVEASADCGPAEDSQLPSSTCAVT
jgi:DNA-binding response OmpR family regulator